ncbi:nicotianamine synthase family protein [Bacillus gaemokensis]|uniref:Ribosomal RNA methyltransferase FmrO domain protein n=1 Tax=Bacillus gaemokensis TaxID=574375 RepID=A0A073K6N1_9BACI|nr:nicotianamine synthase family protein [Bacillus gaemokensis]KEK22127.1 ribosomal RNA methyltransferase FmrO domain protein [Bacillus gaemokensis]KYG35513.1 rRNA methyltransferase [Bacillus gaemokensis]
MNVLEKFQDNLIEFSGKFNYSARQYDDTMDNCEELEALIDDYAKFITNKEHKVIWEQLEQQKSGDLDRLVVDLRRNSALCVAIMEKYRALKLQSGNAEIANYFKNIELCIEKEFGSFQITSKSKVLLVGSGSFPMTPLLIAKRTGAEVVGIDIDDDAIQLGLNVVKELGHGLNIRLEKKSVEELDFIKEVTHVIFSSTVQSKYDILDQLYTLTNESVVVAMRYGNGLKSLFNYPAREVDNKKWKIVGNTIRPDHIFDIALYKKV